MRNRVVKGLAALLAMAMLAGCGSNPAPVVENSEGTKEETTGETNEDAVQSGGEKVVTVAAVSAWEALHPFSSNRDDHVAFLYPIYESWVTIKATGEIEPRLFSSWEQSEDGSVLTCKINEDATWSDGEPITAEDIEWTMRTCADPKLDVPAHIMAVWPFVGTDDTGTLIEGEEFGVKALDEKTVQLTYKPAYTSTVLNEFYMLRYTFTLPKHCLENVPVESLLVDPFWENPVTSGAFTLDNIISGERMEYVARDDYYLGRPQMDRLIIRVIPANNILSSMLAGEVDTTIYGSKLSYSDYELAQQEESLVTSEYPGFGNVHLLLNNEHLDQNARLAIDCAVNKESIINDVLYGYGRTAISAIVPENPYRNENVTGNPYDPELAKEYLAKSNLDTSKPLTFIMASTNLLGQTISVLVQQQLAEIGLQINIETFDAATISSMLYSGQYDVALMQSASTPFEPSESNFYFKPVPDNWNRIADASWNELYMKGMEGLTIEDRKPVYDELQERLVAEVPMAFLYHPDMLFVNSKKVNGMPYEDFSLKGWKYETWNVE